MNDVMYGQPPDYSPEIFYRLAKFQNIQATKNLK